MNDLSFDESNALSETVVMFMEMPIRKLRYTIKSLKKYKTVEAKEVIDILQLIINKKKIKV